MRWSSARKCVVLALVAIILILQGCQAERSEEPAKKSAESPPTHPAEIEPKVHRRYRRPRRRVPLKLKIPEQIFCVLMRPYFNEPNVEKFNYRHMDKRAAFMVPSGTENLAAYRPVTSNEALPVIGELGIVTDDEISGEGGYSVNIGFEQKWIQIDLEQCAPIYAIVVWHQWRQGQCYSVYRDVIVQVSNTPDFKSGVQTLFNNDHDNSSGMGRGKDKGYYETRFGKIIDA
ncbi:MAG: hypothetical protein GY794_04250, partial [bacterium]|nr:hypothetical protein [bacterium]